MTVADYCPSSKLPAADTVRSPSTVEAVNYAEDGSAIAIISCACPLASGDKICSRNGTKHVSIVLPDAEMPVLDRGDTVDLCLCPAHQMTRQSLGLAGCGATLRNKPKGYSATLKHELNGYSATMGSKPSGYGGTQGYKPCGYGATPSLKSQMGALVHEPNGSA